MTDISETQSRKTPIAIGVLEDDDTMRRYLEQTLAQQEDFTLVFSEPTLAGAKAAAARVGHVDLCLVDLQLPDGSGTDFVGHVRETYGARALILTVLGDKTSVISAFRSGADGYLLKDSDPEQILRNIRQAADGANPISAQVSSHLLSLVRDDAAQSEVARADKPSPLNPRETDVLTLFAKGMSYKETAQSLSVSSHTVNHYVKAIYSKMDVNSRNEAVFEALQNGWIKP